MTLDDDIAILRLPLSPPETRLLIRSAEFPAFHWPQYSRRPLWGAGSLFHRRVDSRDEWRREVERLVDPNEVNELDRAAEAVQAESSWSSYLSLLLGAALAAASAMWFFLRVASIFARRAANLRMHMSNPKRATALGLEAPYFPRFCSLIPRFSVKLSAIRAHCSLRDKGLPSA
jgi:hypothetical protein